MSLSVDLTYIGMLGQRLNLFRQVNSTTFNFRCNICGDSAKNPYKRRAYFYKNKSGDSFNFQCHNCSGSHSLYRYIELCFPEYLKAYKFENFSNQGKQNSSIEEAIPFKKKELVMEDIMPMDMLPWNHKAVRYLTEERKLPHELLEKFLYVDRYVEWLKKTNQDDDLTYKEHSRILIPYTNREDFIYRYAARSFDCNIAAKYLYTEIDIGNPIYNYHHVDPKKKVYVVEGQIDAMILGNQAVAIGNGNYSRGDFTSFEEYVIIPDNEPRNSAIVKSLGKAIEAGCKVCIWPRYLGKDINEITKQGTPVKDILSIVDENTFSGIKAKIKFEQWRKV